MSVDFGFVFRVDLVPTSGLFSKILIAVAETGVIKKFRDNLAQREYQPRKHLRFDEAASLLLDGAGVELVHMLPDGNTTEIVIAVRSCPPPYSERPTEPPFLLTLTWMPGRGLWENGCHIAEAKLLSMIEVANAVLNTTRSSLGIGGDTTRHVWSADPWDAGLCRTPLSLRGRRLLPWAMFAATELFPNGRARGIENICWRVEDLPGGNLMLIRTSHPYMKFEEDLENSEQVKICLGLR